MRAQLRPSIRSPKHSECGISLSVLSLPELLYAFTSTFITAQYKVSQGEHASPLRRVVQSKIAKRQFYRPVSIGMNRL
jgi:hypothetical protein